MSALYGREVSNGEVADVLGATVKEVERLLLDTQPLISLEMRVGDLDNGDALCDLIVDQKTPDPSASTKQRGLRDALDQVLRGLTRREAFVLRLRYGMNDDNEPRTLQEIADILGLSRERVRQIEAGSMKKIRKQKRLSDLI